jgi:hypothetical protein
LFNVENERNKLTETFLVVTFSSGNGLEGCTSPSENMPSVWTITELSRRPSEGMGVLIVLLWWYLADCVFENGNKWNLLEEKSK